MPHYCAAVNCYNLSNKVRLSFFRFPKEVDRYSNVHFETPDIYKNMFCPWISMFFASSDMTSSAVDGSSSPISKTISSGTYRRIRTDSLTASTKTLAASSHGVLWQFVLVLKSVVKTRRPSNECFRVYLNGGQIR
jgi:hypothetical protein